MILYSFVQGELKKVKTHHYLTDLTSKTLEFPKAFLLIIEEKDDGVYLNRFTENGDKVGDTWHLNIDEAKEQATFEFEDVLSSWKEIAENIDEPEKYILGKLERIK